MEKSRKRYRNCYLIYFTFVTTLLRISFYTTVIQPPVFFSFMFLLGILCFKPSFKSFIAITSSSFLPDSASLHCYKILFYVYCRSPLVVELTTFVKRKKWGKSNKNFAMGLKLQDSQIFECEVSIWLSQTMIVELLATFFQVPCFVCNEQKYCQNKRLQKTCFYYLSLIKCIISCKMFIEFSCIFILVSWKEAPVVLLC